MNKLILASCGLSLLITAAHILGGGPEFHDPVLQGPMAADAKAVYSILWHFASLVMAVNTLVLFRSAMRRGFDSVVVLVAVQYLIFAGLFLFYGWTRLGGIFLLPQWSIFIAIAACALLGVSQSRDRMARSA